MNSNVNGTGADEGEDVKKMSERQTKAGNQERFLMFSNVF